MSTANTSIILLEDDRTLRELIADGLRAAGHAVIETPTGAQAVAAVNATQGRAVLVADRSVDPKETGPNGFQIAAQALGQYPALRVIYISGHHLAVRRRPLGPRERALMKPFAMSQLLATVRDLA